MRRPLLLLRTTKVVSGASHVLSASFEGTPLAVAPFVTKTELDDSYLALLLGLDLVRAHGASVRFTYGSQTSSHTNSYAVGLKLWVPLP